MTLFDAYVAMHGRGRARRRPHSAVRATWPSWRRAEQARPPPPPKEFGDQPRQILVELYGERDRPGATEK